MTGIPDNAMVRLTRDVESKSRGEIGVVIAVLGNGEAYDVEFVDGACEYGPYVTTLHSVPDDALEPWVAPSL